MHIHGPPQQVRGTQALGRAPTQVASGRRDRVVFADGSRGRFLGLPAVQGHPTPTGNDRSPRHLNWSEPWASSVPLVSGPVISRRACECRRRQRPWPGPPSGVGFAHRQEVAAAGCYAEHVS